MIFKYKAHFEFLLEMSFFQLISRELLLPTLQINEKNLPSLWVAHGDCWCRAASVLLSKVGFSQLDLDSRSRLFWAKPCEQEIRS